MANSVPTLAGLNSSASFLENTVNATPQLIDASVTLTDRDGNLPGGTLTVTGLLPEDVISIRNAGTGVGQIGFFAGIVTYQGVLIGQAFGGAGGTFAVVLNASASPAAIEALIENLTYANTSDVPTTSRTLSINLTDSAGAAAIAPLAFTERTGSSNPLGALDVGFHSTSSFADLDGDGDLDAIVGNLNGDLIYFANIGTANAPVFGAAAVNPFGLPAPVILDSAPSFVDLDRDGDMDIVLGREGSALVYYPNVGTATAPAFGTPVTNLFPFIVTAFDLAPSFGDLDGDGDMDAIEGTRSGSVYYFENTGTASAPAFPGFVSNPFGLANIGEDDSKPFLADLDSDGDLDLIAGGENGNLIYFENTGAAHAPAFAAPIINPFGWADVGDRSAPSFADLDGDGDLDAVIGEFNGLFKYFENTTLSLDITINVTAANDAPSVSGPALLGSILEDSSARLITQAELLANATDVDSPSLTAVNLQIAAGAGSLVDNGNGTWSFTPATNDDTDATFSYQVTDGVVAVAASAKLDLTPVAEATLGTSGDDSFNAPSGDSAFDAGPGVDTMTFNFRLVDASFAWSGTKLIITRDADEVVLSGFERFVFTDGTVDNNDGSVLVDDLFYYAHNHDVWNAHVDADSHYNTFGWHEGRNPNALFDTAGYLATYGDVRAAGVNPLDHYHQFGWREGRDPSVGFDTTDYLAANPDVAAAGVDPLLHYLHFGRYEGRSPQADGVLG